MLVFIFGVWMNVAQIVSLSPSGNWSQNDCKINLGSMYSSYVYVKNKTCDQVAEEINKAGEK